VRALFANTYFWHELVHMYLAAFMVTGFLVAGAYAFGRLRGRWGRYERTALAVPLTAASVAAPLQVLVGDWAARDVATEEPIKLAALEGLARTTAGAPEHLLGFYTDGQVRYGIEIPRLLSLLSFHNPNAVVRGLDTVPVTDQPPVNVVRFAFQSMVGIGTLLVLLAAVFLVVRWRRDRLPNSRWFYWAVVTAGPLAYIALVAGFQRSADTDSGDDQDEEPEGDRRPDRFQQRREFDDLGERVHAATGCSALAASEPGPKTGVSEIVSAGSAGVRRLARKRKKQPIARMVQATIAPKAPPPSSSITAKTSAEAAAAAGRVSSQPATMLRITIQLTLAPGRPTPEPATAPETTCVVDSG